MNRAPFNSGSAMVLISKPWDYEPLPYSETPKPEAMVFTIASPQGSNDTSDWFTIPEERERRRSQQPFYRGLKKYRKYA